MDKVKLSSEEELVIIQEGLNSQFWAVYSAWISHAAVTSAGAALSERVSNRDWQAGHAEALKRALNYPTKRLRELKTQIEQSRKQS